MPDRAAIGMPIALKQNLRGSSICATNPAWMDSGELSVDSDIRPGEQLPHHAELLFGGVDQPREVLLAQDEDLSTHLFKFTSAGPIAPVLASPPTELTTAIRTDAEAALAEFHTGCGYELFVQTVAGVTTVFGLVGKNTATKTAFVAIRGTQTQTEWLQNLDFDTTGYRPVPDFGDVHMGWMGLYETMRANLAANLPAACAGCDQLIVTGHSLGAALAVLAAPDIAKNISVVPEPKLTTFGGPRPGLHDFVVPFNLLIDSCFRVVNLFDIVPHLPLALPGLPYEHVGVQIAVNSGGSIDQTHRHSLDAYRAGLTSLISTQPAWAA